MRIISPADFHLLDLLLFARVVRNIWHRGKFLNDKIVIKEGNDVAERTIKINVLSNIITLEFGGLQRLPD